MYGDIRRPSTTFPQDLLLSKKGEGRHTPKTNYLWQQYVERMVATK